MANKFLRECSNDWYNGSYGNDSMDGNEHNNDGANESGIHNTHASKKVSRDYSTKDNSPNAMTIAILHNSDEK